MKEDNMKQGWEIKKLGEVCTFCSGYTPKENEFKKCATIPVPYFKVSDMNHLENHKYLTYTTLYLENGCKTYPKHTIVFPKNGAAIATNKKRLLGQDSVVDLNTGGVIANDKIVFYEYLYLFLLNLDFRLFTRRGAVPTLDIAELKKQTIPVPPRPVQEQIVSELDLLSGIIEKKREQLEELDALAQSIFYDMFGDPITNEKGWEVKKLGEEFNISSGGTPDTKITHYWDGGNISWIGSNMCQNEIIYNNDGKYITDLGLSNSSAKVYQEGYVLVALVGATIGKTALLRFPTATNQNVAGINVPQNSEYTSEFIFCLIRNLYELFVSIGSGKFKMANLSFIRSLPLLSPPLPLQHQFASKIEAIERQKELIKQSISETETLFNARMQHYFN